MQEYHKRIAKTAVRCSGQPVTLSPLIFHDSTNIKSVAGSDVDFRVVLFMGCIDSNDLTITFPEETVVKVHVKHDIKAIDQESNRRKLLGYGGNRSTTAVVCSRDCATYYRLPKGVEKSNLTAQLTQDCFLIIQNRKERSSVFGFESKRLVPVKGCLNLNPCLSAHDLSQNATELAEVAYKLWQRVKDIKSQVAVEDLDSSFGSEPETDAFTGSVAFQYSRRSAFEPASITHSEGARGDADSSGQDGTSEETNQRTTSSTKSAEEICEEKTTSANESEAGEVETGSTSESVPEATRKNTDGSEPVDTEETTKRKTRSAKSTVEEIFKEKTGSSQSKVAQDDTSCSAHDEVEEATKRKTRSEKSAAEVTSKKEIGPVRSTQPNITEPTVDQEIETEAPPKRITRSTLKMDETDKKQADDLKSTAGKDDKEIVPGSQTAEGGSQEAAGSDSIAEESGSKPSEAPRRVRSKERPKESSTISKLKEESKRRKSVV